jgi:hypothetical protein
MQGLQGTQHVRTSTHPQIASQGQQDDVRAEGLGGGSRLASQFVLSAK